MRQLFLNNDLTWTKDAEEIVKEVKPALSNIMEKWSKLGFSPRQITYLLAWAVNEVETDYLIEQGEKMSKSFGGV